MASLKSLLPCLLVGVLLVPTTTAWPTPEVQWHPLEEGPGRHITTTCQNGYLTDHFLWPGDYHIGYRDDDGKFHKQYETWGFGLTSKPSDRPCSGNLPVTPSLEAIAAAEAATCGCMVMVVD